MVLRKWEYQAQGCAWSVTTENLETYVELLKLHMQANHAQVAANSSSKTEKAKRPELGSDISEEDWSYFKSRWKEYKKATNLKGEDIISQLMECCTEQLRRDHHKTYLTAEQTDAAREDTRLESLRRLLSPSGMSLSTESSLAL